ncbi:MAG: hypothetical protein AB7Q00_14770 [Phycisphaerales bacterium]
MAKIWIDSKCKSKRNVRVLDGNGGVYTHSNGNPIKFKTPESARRWAAEKRISIND